MGDRQTPYMTTESYFIMPAVLFITPIPNFVSTHVLTLNLEGEYPTPVYHSVISLDGGHNLYNVIHACGISPSIKSSRYVASQHKQVHWEAT